MISPDRVTRTQNGWVFVFVQPAGSSRSFTWATWADTL